MIDAHPATPKLLPGDRRTRQPLHLRAGAVAMIADMESKQASSSRRGAEYRRERARVDDVGVRRKSRLRTVGKRPSAFSLCRSPRLGPRGYAPPSA